MPCDILARSCREGSRNRHICQILSKDLEKYGREGADLAEAAALVDAPGGMVVVVDIEADHRGDLAQRVGDHRGHPGGGDSFAAAFGMDPDALDLAAVRRDGAELGLEDDHAVLHPYVHSVAGDRAGDPAAVMRAAVAAE